jgi:hypothetical protein
MASTTYVVLTREGDGERWIHAGNISASSSEAAVREAAARNGGGSYVAIPARSFKPTVVKVETKQVVSLG